MLLAKKNKDYWADRFVEIEDNGNKMSENAYQNYIDSLQKTQIELNRDIEKWLNRIAKNNNLSPTEARKLLDKNELTEFRWTVDEYIKYGEKNAVSQLWVKELENASAKAHITRLEALKFETKKKLEFLAFEEERIANNLVRTAYEQTYLKGAFEIARGTNKGVLISSINDKKLDNVVSTVLVGDGRHFSERIWSNTSALSNALHNELIKNIALGKNPNESIKYISQFANGKFENAKKSAKRLLYNEASYYSSKAQHDMFKDLGVEWYEIVVTLDSRTSRECKDADSWEPISIELYEIGSTAPPFHVYCRSTTVPNFDKEDEELGLTGQLSEGQRAARGEDGKTYYVSSDISYSEWKKSFITDDNKANDGLKEIDHSDIIKDINEKKKLQESIITKNQGVFQTEEQKIEFENILSNHGVRELNLYNKLSDKFNNNIYNKQCGAAYYPNEKVVRMHINNNDWEKNVGNGKTGSWHTKFHEEFHQLDHILSQSKFANLPDGQLMKYNNKFTNGNTVIGQKIIESIDNDVLSVINKSVDWLNNTDGLNIKHLKNIDRISRDSYLATIKYLKYNYDTPKLKAQIAIFTDAMGLSTKNRINPHGNGFWGHDATYNKERGKNGASSETWATFGSLIYAGDEETISVVKSLMPETWATLISVFDELLEYTLTNDIEY